MRFGTFGLAQIILGCFKNLKELKKNENFCLRIVHKQNYFHDLAYAKFLEATYLEQTHL